jgi:hypothetical protein
MFAQACIRDQLKHKNKSHHERVVPEPLDPQVPREQERQDEIQRKAESLGHQHGADVLEDAMDRLHFLKGRAPTALASSRWRAQRSYFVWARRFWFS